MGKLAKTFWNEPSVAVHVAKGLTVAIVAVIALWPLSTSDLIVVASSLGLTVPAGLGARALTKPAKPKR